MIEPATPIGPEVRLPRTASVVHSKNGLPPRCLAAAKPFLKWAGGKSRLVRELKRLYPVTFNSYFEPFVGGGAVYFDLRPEKAFLNDLNTALVGAYANIKERPDEVIEILRRLQKDYSARSEEERKALFYDIRDRYNNLEAGLPKKSAYLIFLNKTCFNGMYRESSTGHFNVPFGRYANPRVCDEENLRAVSALLQATELTSVPFDKAVERARRGDFIYFDPPYHPLSKTSSFTGYHARDFTEADQRHLRQVFGELHVRGCHVMVSNSYTPFIRNLYRGFPQHVVMAGRAINCKANGRGKIKESVITSYPT